MDFLLSRYRNMTALLLVILAQLVLLAWQVKSSQDVRLIRVWSVSAVTPMARVLEFVRENTIGVAENYFVLVNVRNENQRMKAELGKLKMENQFLKTELSTADRVRALQSFQQRTPSRTLPARIIGTGTGANSRVVFVDQGSSRGVMRGMAVVTPDGIVGKVLAAYPTASQVLLITDPTFAAGVISEKNRVHGTVKGVGQNKVIVDYVQNEEKVDNGEMFYTSGDDRIFPKGMPVGRVTVVREGRTFKEIYLVPAGFQQGLEEVLVVIEGVHDQIPDQGAPSGDVYLAPPVETVKPAVPAAPLTGPDGTPISATPGAPAGVAPAAVLSTDADRLRERYKKIGEAQGHAFGEPTGRPPNFNLNPDQPKPGSVAPRQPAGTGAPTGQAPATGSAQIPAPRPQTVVPQGVTPQPTPLAQRQPAGTGQPVSGTPGSAAPRPATPKPTPQTPVSGQNGAVQPAPEPGKPATTTARPPVSAGTVAVPPRTVTPQTQTARPAQQQQ